jgi:hypothetical protein
VFGWIWSSGMLSKINFLHFLSGCWEQILSVYIHISNQYHASPYHHQSTCTYDDYFIGGGEGIIWSILCELGWFWRTNLWLILTVVY